MITLHRDNFEKSYVILHRHINTKFFSNRHKIPQLEIKYAHLPASHIKILYVKV